MNKAFAKYIADWDPMGLIKINGLPADEYSSEIATVILKFKPEMSNDDVGQLVYDIFTQHIGLDPLGFHDECIKRGHEMREILVGEVTIK